LAKIHRNAPAEAAHGGQHGGRAMGGSTITLIILAAIAAYAIYAYNALVKARQMVKEAWSGIDVQLKRRADLIPNLVETVKGYASHEREALEKVTEMRTRAQSVPAGDIAGRAAAEGMLGQALGRLMAVAEAYPDLKANTNFLELQEQLGTVEGEIQMSRRYYNGATRDLNVMVESFPSNFVASTFKFEKSDYFELENPDDRKTPQVSFNKS
jgi:LemA protein